MTDEHFKLQQFQPESGFENSGVGADQLKIQGFSLEKKGI